MSPPHSLTREEVFVVLEGTASVEIDGVEGVASPGDAIVVPSATTFTLSNLGASPLRMLCCLPVGGQAALGDGSMFTPPWAE
jgi:mannose-6-phosphate isomerase-like protein (cupin superfamily)